MPVTMRMAMCPTPGASGASQHRSSLRFHCYPLAGGSGGMACLQGWDRSATIPLMPSRFAVALRASIDRMSPPRW